MASSNANATTSALSELVRQTIHQQVTAKRQALDRGLRQVHQSMDQAVGRQQVQMRHWLHQLKYAHLWDAARIELLLEHLQQPPSAIETHDQSSPNT